MDPASVVSAVSVLARVAQESASESWREESTRLSSRAYPTGVFMGARGSIGSSSIRQIRRRSIPAVTYREEDRHRAAGTT